MASPPNTQRNLRTSKQRDSTARLLNPTVARKQPQGIAKAHPQVRRSTRIWQRVRDREAREAEQASLTPPADKAPKGTATVQTFRNSSKLHQKRKREAEASSSQAQDSPPTKRPRTSPPNCKIEDELEEEAGSTTSQNKVDPIETWIQTAKWPSQYFQPDSKTREHFDRDSWLEEQMSKSSHQVVQYVEIGGYIYPRPIRKLPTSLRRKQSDSNLTGSSDQKNRESKSTQYRDPRYVTLLATKGSYMCEFNDDDIPKSIMDLCKTLLAGDQIVPRDSLFRDDLFKKTCRKIEDRNEAMVIQDITRLIVPSAQTLAIYGARNLEHLIEGVNERWAGSIPVEGPRPQPDYSVGFKRSAFTAEQLKKLDPLIGTLWDTSLFVATYRMYFPFLTCEVKCGASGLDIADRQNAHSMTVAMKGIFALFKAVKREKELHREILAFSVSHDHRSVRIYAHYPVIDGRQTTFYRHPVHVYDFSITASDGSDKWTAYKFTRNVYDLWMPTHLKRICSAIDQLPPDLNFEVSQESELRFTEASEVSQDLDGLLLNQSDVASTALTSPNDSEPAAIVPQTLAIDPSVSQGKARAQSKRPKRKHIAK